MDTIEEIAKAQFFTEEELYAEGLRFRYSRIQEEFWGKDGDDVLFRIVYDPLIKKKVILGKVTIETN